MPPSAGRITTRSRERHGQRTAGGGGAPSAPLSEGSTEQQLGQTRMRQGQCSASSESDAIPRAVPPRTETRGARRPSRRSQGGGIRMTLRGSPADKTATRPTMSAALAAAGSVGPVALRRGRAGGGVRVAGSAGSRGRIGAEFTCACPGESTGRAGGPVPPSSGPTRSRRSTVARSPGPPMRGSWACWRRDGRIPQQSHGRRVDARRRSHG